MQLTIGQTVTTIDALGHHQTATVLDLTQTHARIEYTTRWQDLVPRAQLINPTAAAQTIEPSQAPLQQIPIYHNGARVNPLGKQP